MRRWGEGDAVLGAKVVTVFLRSTKPRRAAISSRRYAAKPTHTAHGKKRGVGFATRNRLLGLKHLNGTLRRQGFWSTRSGCFSFDFLAAG